MVFLYSCSWFLFRFVSCYWCLTQLLIYCLFWFFLFPWSMCSSWKKSFFFHTYICLAIFAFVLEDFADFSLHTSSSSSVLQLSALPVLIPVAVQCLHVGAVKPFLCPLTCCMLCCAEGHSWEPQISGAPWEQSGQKGLIPAPCSSLFLSLASGSQRI